jgi:uncharacterized membrane protein YqjE
MSAGLLESARAALAGLITLGRTRFELFGTELREELARLATLLLGGLTVVLLAALGVAFGAFALVMAVGEQYRVLAACAVAAAFVALALLLLWALVRFAKVKERAFDATLTELARDYEAIKP